MTGFGQAEITTPSGIYRVEISGVNNRFLNIQIRSPRIFSNIESNIRDYLSTKVNRGSVTVMVNWSRENKIDQLDWDQDTVSNYMHIFHEIRKKHNLKNDVTLSDLLNFNDIIQEQTIAYNEEILWKHLKKALVKASEEFTLLRQKEASFLISEIKKLLKTISRTLGLIENRAPIRLKKYKVELKNKIEQLAGKITDPTRLTIEISLMADKLDITEECTRLHAHIKKMSTDLNGSGPIGKRLGFILQEMNREANTISSKANDTKISFWSVDLKENIEKIREQVLNIE
jgi:uncharacterized protein (TIGR00255 family)